jgi:hypothetical protein
MTKQSCCFLLCLLFVGLRAYAQTTFSGHLINTLDSNAVPFAVIKLHETDKTVIADSNGFFSFILPGKFKVLNFTVSVTGRKSVVQHKLTAADTQNVYTEVLPFLLQEAEIKGLSARDIVKKAVLSIPANYADSSYFAYSSYRQYQKVNDIYMNLVEATPVVMFKLKKKADSIVAKEAYALRNIRRTETINNHMNEQRDNLADLMVCNPVYHISASALALNHLGSYRFSFDSSSNKEEYVINYLSPKHTVETFGFVGWDLDRLFRGFAYETGKLYIDRKTFAFRRIERQAFRNPGYSFYQSQANIIYPDRKYFFEFVGGTLIADYEQSNGKWFLSGLYRKYTTDFFYTGFGTKECTITDVFEWQADSLSLYVPGELLKSFFPRLMEYAPYSYNKAYWQDVAFPFYFYDEQAVMHCLARAKDVDAMFAAEGLSK